jgi:hypothetical protein
VVVAPPAGTAWMDAGHRPPVAQVDGFAMVDRVTRADCPHPMITRNCELVERRLRQCSLYDPALDLAVEDADRMVAGFVQTSIDRLLIRPATHEQCGQASSPQDTCTLSFPREPAE